MILGTCNFGQEYNGYKMPVEVVNKVLDKFYELGGEIIDTACNYNNHKMLIGYPGKIQTKIWHIDDIDKCFDELKTDKIYSILLRNSKDDNALLKLMDYKKKGLIEKYGISIYYPFEIIQRANIVQFQCDPLFNKYIDTISLYADIQIRSYYNHFLKCKYSKDHLFLQKLKNNKKVQFITGVDTVDQLKKNMELFNGL